MTFRVLACLALILFSNRGSHAQEKTPPYDLWSAQVRSQIRDRSTLEIEVQSHALYLDVFFTSNPSASWFDEVPPYAEHNNERIRIHGFLASPRVGGPYPAVVIGHGHQGKADRDLALLIAGMGYVALAIDGPRAGESTGGPKDDNQTWISVDKGPQYGYLYHYAYAGMRALTVLEALAATPGNPYRIDPTKLGILGASMGGILTTYVNGIDDRVKSAIIIASAGNWQHTLRYPNSWLYHGIYTGTRDQPYNGNDPLNSIENIDTDSTAIEFLNYFDPIRYAPRQHAPVLTVIGTHDEYFPLPNANLMELAITSAGQQSSFEKRLWLVPNAPHSLENAEDPLVLAAGIRQWLEYSIGRRARPLATPEVALAGTDSGLRFEITMGEPTARLEGATVKLYVGTRVDSTVSPIADFKPYAAVREGSRFVVQIPAGERTSSGEIISADNAVYFATANDGQGLPVSSLVYKGRRLMDLSTDFVPAIEQWPGDGVIAPIPPVRQDAAVSLISSVAVTTDAGYQGVSLTNPTANPIAARVEARDPEGRIAAAEGLINPVFMTIAPYSQRIFLFEEWLGPGARRFNGSFRVGWSEARATTLAFRGDVWASEIESIGPLDTAATSVWIPLAPELGGWAKRRVRIVSAADEGANVNVIFRNCSGDTLEQREFQVPGNGIVDVIPPSEGASAEVRADGSVAARLEASGGKDPWSIEGKPPQIAKRLIQPYVEWNGAFATRLLLLNTTSEPQTATVRLHPTFGNAVASDKTVTILGNNVVSDTIESLMGIPSSMGRGAGWFEVETTGASVVVVALAVDPKTGAAAASALQAAVAGTWSMPFFVENAGYYTGLAIVNAGDVPASIDITAYGPSGSIVGHVALPLGVGENRAKLLYQWIPDFPVGATGQLLITSSGPITLLAYFGTHDGASLAAIPFTRMPS